MTAHVVVFDFAGVVFSWQPEALMARLLPQRAETPEAALALSVAFFQGFGGDWGEFDRGTIAPAPLCEQIARRLGLTVAEVRRVVEAIPRELAPIPGTLALIERLKAQGHRLYFLSNMPASYADHLDAQHAFLGRLFLQGMYSARVRLIKPEAQIFAHAQQIFGFAPAEAVFIDDMAANVAAARTAGWQAVQFRDPAQCEAELQGLGLRF